MNWMIYRFLVLSIDRFALERGREWNTHSMNSALNAGRRVVIVWFVWCRLMGDDTHDTELFSAFFGWFHLSLEHQSMCNGCVWSTNWHNFLRLMYWMRGVNRSWDFLGISQTSWDSRDADFAETLTYSTLYRFQRLLETFGNFWKFFWRLLENFAYFWRLFKTFGEFFWAESCGCVSGCGSSCVFISGSGFGSEKVLKSLQNYQKVSKNLESLWESRVIWNKSLKSHKVS